MFSIGPAELTVLLGVVLVPLLVLIAIARSGRNPIVNVADEVTCPMSYADADSEVPRLLATARRVELRMVLPGTYTLSYRHYPGFAVFLAVITFPIGLLILFLARQELTLTVSLSADEDRTRIKVLGRSHKRLALSVGEALESLAARSAQKAA